MCRLEEVKDSEYVYLCVCGCMSICVYVCMSNRVYVVLLASCCAVDMRVRYYGLILLTW